MSKQDFRHQLQDRGNPITRPVSLFNAVHLDAPLLGMLLLLIGCGLGVLYSASGGNGDLVMRQATRFAIGLPVMMLLAQIHPHTFRRWSPWLFVAGTVLLVLVLFIGTQAKGAQRWLPLPGIGRFQPSEVMKLFMPMMIAWFLAGRSLPPSLSASAIAAALIVIPTLLIAQQPDLGTSLLIASAGFIALFLAGLRVQILAGMALAAIPTGYVVWHFMREYQRQRVLTFLNPESDPWGAGWNIIQSKTAIGSGGFSGKGWQEGTQAQLDFLPESHTDFIIAVLGEEFGFIGMFGLLLLYVLIVARGMVIAANATDTYSRLLAGAITLTFFVYVFVNIGMVSGLLPVVGVPLPLVSYGGTSIVTLLAGFGILMSVQTHKNIVTQ